MIDVVLAGDAIPQVKVLANSVAEVLANVPSCWGRADARVLNLEAPVGERAALPGDKSLLYFASPPTWVGDLQTAAKASAIVVANNHSCDLGAEGLAQTVSVLQRLGVPPVGAVPSVPPVGAVPSVPPVGAVPADDAADPFRPVKIAERGGRTVCLSAWTTFINDRGKRAKSCLESPAVRLARAEIGPRGADVLHQAFDRPGVMRGCDARIAYIHGGREYQGQIRPLLEQATLAARWFDAVVVSHPHVPDGVELVTAEGSSDRPAGRRVPVFRSLGNFISNQGVGWSPGMRTDVIRDGDRPDPIRTVWTRVSVLARLRFSFRAQVSAPSTAYGYSLAFTDRPGVGALDIRLRAMPAGESDGIARALAGAPAPFGPLLTDRCRFDPEAPLACQAEGS